MKAIIAGGGTGGHVFPAIAVGAELVKRGAEVVFIGTKTGLEARMIHRMGWKIEYLSAPRWMGEGGLGKLTALLRIPPAVFKAMRIIAKYNPDIVIGVGGYISAPALTAAVIRRIPTLIMEQNSIPGLANRVLGRFVKRICISLDSSRKYFKPARVIVTGNPVRAEIREISTRLPPFQDRFVLMCVGGSQGAKSINEAMFASLRFLRNRRHGIKIIHQTGSGMDIEIARDIYRKEDFDAEVYRFIDDMADCYARSHLVISRAGATTIAELAVTGRPAVLVPYPFAGGHQAPNAKEIAEGGGAVTILDKHLTGEKLAGVVCEFINRPDKLEEMNRSMIRMSRPDAAEAIVEECFRLCSGVPECRSTGVSER